ncbi:hypothetical protein EMCRGX_G015206 [Ephydatia muelleri]
MTGNLLTLVPAANRHYQWMNTYQFQCCRRHLTYALASIHVILLVPATNHLYTLDTTATTAAINDPAKWTVTDNLREYWALHGPTRCYNNDGRYSASKRKDAGGLPLMCRLHFCGLGNQFFHHSHGEGGPQLTCWGSPDHDLQHAGTTETVVTVPIGVQSPVVVSEGTHFLHLEWLTPAQPDGVITLYNSYWT